MSPPRFTPEFKDEAVRQIVDRGYSQSLKSQQGLAFHRTAFTSGLKLLSQTKPTNKTPNCLLEKVKFSD